MYRCYSHGRVSKCLPKIPRPSKQSTPCVLETTIRPDHAQSTLAAAIGCMLQRMSWQSVEGGAASVAFDTCLNMAICVAAGVPVKELAFC